MVDPAASKRLCHLQQNMWYGSSIGNSEECNSHLYNLRNDTSILTMDFRDDVAVAVIGSLNSQNWLLSSQQSVK